MPYVLLNLTCLMPYVSSCLTCLLLCVFSYLKCLTCPVLFVLPCLTWLVLCIPTSLTCSRVSRALWFIYFVLSVLSLFTCFCTLRVSCLKSFICQYHLFCSCFPMLQVTFSYLFLTREFLCKIYHSLHKDNMQVAFWSDGQH